MAGAPRTLFASLTGVLLVASAQAAEVPRPSLADLSLEELGEIQVMSVSRQSESLSDAPASVYVVTNEQIRRSAATTLGEALRLAPNLQVARIDSMQYSISARGFNNAIANKLLVMIDGRTVYTPLFSGVFWDQQDVLLEDVDRIEVISGPGATLWGVNAVNGVINVVTKPASSTGGVYATVGGGNRERRGAARLGMDLGDSGALRVYAKAEQLAATHRTTGMPALDEWERVQAGMRADWQLARDSFTLQADIYEGESQDRGTFAGFDFGAVTIAGANVLGRWSRPLGRSELEVQAFFDHAERDDSLFFRPKADTFDVEVHHAVAFGAHDVLWGGGYRRSKDEIGTGFTTTFIPPARELEWANLFAQDRITITSSLELTMGLKLERNDYTGTESLPSLRLAWRPNDKQVLWTALSRAVRAPSRFDRDVFFPGSPPFFVVGGPNFVSEVAEVVDLGFRAEPTNTLSYSITGFHHDWDKLRSGSALPVQLENGIAGDVYGIEAWLTWRVTRAWQLRAGALRLEKDLHLKPGSMDPVGVDNETLANDPDYQVSLRGTADLGRNVELDVRVRRVDDLPNPAVPSYTAVDASLGWRASSALTLRATVTSANDSLHAEYGPSPTRSEQDRGFYLSITHRAQGAR